MPGFYTFNQELIEKQPTKENGNINYYRLLDKDIKGCSRRRYTQKTLNLGQKLPSTNYEEFNRKVTYGEGDPGKRNFDRSDPYGEGFSEGWEGTVDQVNYQKLYTNRETADDKIYNKDIIPFYITSLDNDDPNDNVHIHFRAFIDSFSDNYSSDWASHKFMGRGKIFIHIMDLVGK